MNLDELEFSITQYLDGTLPPLERAALENRLSNDPKAREILAEQQKLNALLATAAPLPSIQWDRLHQHISRSVDQADPPAAQHYRIGTRRIFFGIAAAACVLIAAAISFVLLRPDHITPQHPTAAADGPSFASVAVLTGEQPQGVPITQIKVGPAPTLTAGTVWRYSDAVVSRPAQVFIAKGQVISQDASSLPF